MSEYPTIEELLALPIKTPRHDPFFHTQQFPYFMKRKIILGSNYSDPISSPLTFQKARPFKPKPINESTPYQSRYKPYGRTPRRSHYSANSTPLHENPPHDQALYNQRLFTSISPSDSTFTGDFRSSACPSTPLPPSIIPKLQALKPTGSKKPLRKVHKITKDINTDKLRESILVVMSKNSPRRCQDCGFPKCQCGSVDVEIPSSVFENINKGKTLAREIREERRKKFLEKVQKFGRRRVKISAESDLMRYTTMMMNSFDRPKNFSSKVEDSMIRRHSS